MTQTNPLNHVVRLKRSFHRSALSFRQNPYKSKTPCGCNSVVECCVPNAVVEGSNPFARSLNSALTWNLLEPIGTFLVSQPTIDPHAWRAT